MAILTKTQLEALNQSSFPDNTSGAITPTILRNYNTQTIDTLVDSLDTGSFATGSLLLTASFDNSTRNLTFTKSNTQTFSINIPDVSGSTLPSGVVSGSEQITQLGFVSSSVTGSSLVTASFSGNTLTFTKGNGTTFGIVIPDVSGSTINTGSFATTGSNTFVGNQSITGSVSVSQTVKSQVYMNPQTLDGFTIPTGNNAMLVGPVTVSGSIVLEGTSNLLVLSQITASALPSGVVSGSSQLTASYDLRYALSGSGGSTIPTGSFATTGSNTFIGNQTITGSLFLSSSDVIVFNVPNFSGAPAPGGLSVTGSVSVGGNFAVVGGNFVVNQINTQKIVGDGGDLSIVSNVKIFNDGNINNARSLGVSGSAFVSQSISVGEAVRLSPSNPLPSGTIGSLAVSGSSLFFYNGAWTLVV